MAKKEQTSIRILASIDFYARQLAEHQHRSFANFVEVVLAEEIDRAKQNGFNFIPYIFEGLPVVGKPGEKDDFLIDTFNKITTQ